MLINNNEKHNEKYFLGDMFRPTLSSPDKKEVLKGKKWQKAMKGYHHFYLLTNALWKQKCDKA